MFAHLCIDNGNCCLPLAEVGIRHSFNICAGNLIRAKQAVGCHYMWCQCGQKMFLGKIWCQQGSCQPRPARHNRVGTGLSAGMSLTIQS